MVEMAIFHVQKGNDFRTRKPKVMVHAFCMPSHDALHLCEVSLNISTGTRVMEQTEGDTADGKTDTQNFRGYNIIPRHLFCGGA